MPQNTHPVAPRGDIQNVPLPGLHECLTWQFNVTVHPELSSIKWVSVLRDPTAQIELSREYSNLTEYNGESLEALKTAFARALWSLAWTSGRMEG